jgi:hypothetical protein
VPLGVVTDERLGLISVLGEAKAHDPFRVVGPSAPGDALDEHVLRHLEHHDVLELAPLVLQ